MVLTLSATSARRRVLWPLAPVAVALLAGGLSAVGLRRSFTLAEVEAVLHARGNWRSLVPLRHTDASGSLYLVLLKGWLHAGSSEWLVRLPSVIAVSLTAAAVYALGARLYDRRVGVAAGVVFATSAYTAGIGRTAAPLALALLGVTVATWLFVWTLETNSVLGWSGYAVVAAASVYAHATSALVLTAHAIALLLRPHSETRRALMAVGAACLLGLPGVVDVLAAHRHLIDPLQQPTLADVARVAHVASGRNVVLLALALAGAAAIALRSSLNAEPWRLALLASWAVLPAGATLVLSIARPSLDVRYLTVATPAVAILAGVAIARLLRREVAIAAAVALAALAGFRLYRLDRDTTENWRRATSAALSAKRPDERVVVTPARALSAFAYYAGRDRGSLTPGGPASLVIVRARTRDTLALARRAAEAPAYALRDERRLDRLLTLQRWERTGLPAP